MLAPHCSILSPVLKATFEFPSLLVLTSETRFFGIDSPLGKKVRRLPRRTDIQKILLIGSGPIKQPESTDALAFNFEWRPLVSGGDRG